LFEKLQGLAYNKFEAMVVTSTPPEYVQSMALLLEHMNKVAGTSGTARSAGVMEQPNEQQYDKDAQSQRATLYEWSTNDCDTSSACKRSCNEPQIPQHNRPSWNNFIAADPSKMMKKTQNNIKVGNKRKVHDHSSDNEESPLKKHKNVLDFISFAEDFSASSATSSPRDLDSWFDQDSFINPFVIEEPFASPPSAGTAGDVSDSSDEDYDCGFLSLADISQDQLLQTEFGIDEDSIEDIVKRAMCQELSDSDSNSTASTPDMPTDFASPAREVNNQTPPQQQHDLRMYETMIQDTFSQSSPMSATSSQMIFAPTLTPGASSTMTFSSTLPYPNIFMMPSPSKQLVCSGAIQRKNKKSQPGDSFQLKWKLK
jgi:hypothetical protein